MSMDGRYAVGAWMHRNGDVHGWTVFHKEPGAAVRICPWIAVYMQGMSEQQAVLFSWLVKSLLNLDVMGLGYVAITVHFTEDVAGDSISYNGHRYVVTDPSYVNASTGMTVLNFKQFKPGVLSDLV